MILMDGKFDREATLGTLYGDPRAGEGNPGSAGLIRLGTLYEYRPERDNSGCLVILIGIGLCFFLERFPVAGVPTFACLVYFIFWARKPSQPDVLLLVTESGEVFERTDHFPNSSLRYDYHQGFLFRGSTGVRVITSATRPVLKDQAGAVVEIEYPWRDSQVMTSKVNGKTVHLIGWLSARNDVDPKVALDVADELRRPSDDHG